MSIQGLNIDNDVESTNTDSLGGGGFVKPTGLYKTVVDMAYLDESSKGALALNLHLKTADGSMNRQTLYMTSGKAKGKKNHYFKDGKKYLLPGMIKAAQIAQILTGKQMAALTPEEKTIKLYDFEAKAEKPTKVQAVTEMIGQHMLVGLIKKKENKRAPNDDGEWVPTNDVREFNEIDKVFYPNGYSTIEKAAKVTDAKVHKAWEEKYPVDYVDDSYVAIKDDLADSFTNTGDDALPDIAQDSFSFDDDEEDMPL